MGIRTLKPTSPARRYLTYVTRDEVTKREPEKSLLVPKTRTSGRNSAGRITVRHRGGGAKRMIRQVDFRRDKFGIPARVAAIEYDPNRSGHLDRKSTRLNSSHGYISYAVFCLKKKK